MKRILVAGTCAALFVGAAAASQEDVDRIPTRRIPLPDDTDHLLPEVADRPLVPCTTSGSGLDDGFAFNPWPGGVVPFQFDANMTAGQQTAATNAMAALSPLADLTFVARGIELSYIHFRDSSANNTNSVGPSGGQVTINLTSWNNMGVVIHEILHAIGFYHEHQRPDRGLFVQIQWGNIQSGSTGNFTLQSSAGKAGPYDFNSIMHYGQCSFSTCCAVGTVCMCPVGCEAILTLPAYQAFQGTMGQRVAVSTLDVHGIRSLYPESHWRFVDPQAPGPWSGAGLYPWNHVVSALAGAPSGARVFVMPGTFSSVGHWDRAMTFEAPVGGVVLR